jgi:hypothetical protein
MNTDYSISDAFTQLLKHYSSEANSERDVMRAAVLYPKTITLLEEKPRVTFNKGLLHGELARFICTNQTLLAYSSIDDVAMIVSLLRKYNSELLASNVDMVHVNKGGINLLRIYNSSDLVEAIQEQNLGSETSNVDIETLISNVGKKLDRSLFVDVNWVRARLYDQASYRRGVLILTVAIVFVLSACTVSLYHNLFKQT